MIEAGGGCTAALCCGACSANLFFPPVKAIHSTMAFDPDTVQVHSTWSNVVSHLLQVPVLPGATPPCSGAIPPPVILARPGHKVPHWVSDSLSVLPAPSSLATSSKLQLDPGLPLSRFSHAPSHTLIHPRPSWGNKISNISSSLSSNSGANFACAARL